MAVVHLPLPHRCQVPGCSEAAEMQCEVALGGPRLNFGKGEEKTLLIQLTKLNYCYIR